MESATRKRLKRTDSHSTDPGWEDVVKTIPSYRPTEEEWKDPMEYVTRITKESSAFGMAHIVPPASWDPPFAIQKASDGVGMDSFVFKVRRQETSKLCHRDAGEDFGFQSLSEHYTLEKFARYADSFKLKHFPHAGGVGYASEDAQRSKYSLPNTCPMETYPSVEEIEEEFWRIVRGEGTVEALYGSDLDNLSFGSGFPMPSGQRWEEMQRRFQNQRGMILERRDDPVDDAYRSHPWNVNNISLASKSLLRYVDDDELISGVMVPWMYVGSCFSAFNWHVEDHALYSINYIHFGSPKVWYSVPGDFSEQLEAAFKDALPHLFEASPSLLHQLVTQLSPVELVKRGVPVYRVVHEPRSFIVTMPHAYHDGFNTGFNVAESVNFAALPWLPYGSKVIKAYRNSMRPVTISHDALLCRMVLNASMVDGSDFTHTIRSIAAVELQHRIRELIQEWQDMEDRFASLGLDIRHVPHECQRHDSHDALNTSESDCIICKGDLWLMGFYSTHDTDALVCINHAHLLVLKEGYPLDSIRISYRYSISDLLELVKDVPQQSKPSKTVPTK